MRYSPCILSALALVLCFGCAQAPKSSPETPSIASIADARSIFLGAHIESPLLERRRDIALAVRGETSRFDRDAWDLHALDDVRSPMRVRVNVDASTYIFFAPSRRVRD